MNTLVESGHVVRRHDKPLMKGTALFVDRVADRLFIDDPDYMARGDVVRVMWDTGPRYDVPCTDLDVRVPDGRKLVWRRGK